MKQKIVSFTKAPATEIDLSTEIEKYSKDGWMIKSVSTSFVDMPRALAYLYTILLEKE